MGIELGKVVFRNDQSGVWKLKLLCVFLTSYIFGSAMGVLGYDLIGVKAMFIPAGLHLVQGLVYLHALAGAPHREGAHGLLANPLNLPKSLGFPPRFSPSKSPASPFDKKKVSVVPEAENDIEMSRVERMSTELTAPLDDDRSTLSGSEEMSLD